MATREEARRMAAQLWREERISGEEYEALASGLEAAESDASRGGEFDPGAAACRADAGTRVARRRQARPAHALAGASLAVLLGFWVAFYVLFNWMLGQLVDIAVQTNAKLPGLGACRSTGSPGLWGGAL